MWKKEIEKLRAIALDCGLTEEVKWRLPCFTLDGNNIVIIQGFKNYCAYMFFKGALMKDPKKILVRIGENTQAARQIRFTNIEDIAKIQSALKSYIKEAIKIEKSGKKVKLKETKDYKVPPELQKKLKANPKLNVAFKALTPGRQRAYLFFISSAKQSATRESKVEKCIPQILKGKGLGE